MLKNKHLLDPSDFTIEEFDEIFKLAHQIMANPKEYQNIFKRFESNRRIQTKFTF